MKKTIIFPILLIGLYCFIFSSCQPDKKAGKLFIIGGGEKPAAMIDKMIQLSGIDKEGYGIVLPMSSIQPDTAILDSRTDFMSRGCNHVYGINYKKGEPISQSRIDSIRNARLIFISGGDQSRFMDAIAGTPIQAAIHEAFENGSVISGTSAGAAVMSRKMITGNELKYPDNNESFKTMEAGNIEVKEGLGMLETVIIDQHFIKRKRLNRLISVCMENPENICAGIDESTALLVEGNTATVYGLNQVIVLRHRSAKTKVENGLLGARNIQLDVLLPGESFRINK
jgi:cyanophycinase